MPSMVPRTAATGAHHPDAVEFVRFCYHRRRVGWPELYDEMCAVAGRGLFRGFSSDDLGGIGVGFSLFDMPGLANLAARVVAEEGVLRRPMSVVVTESESVAAAAPSAAEASGLSDPAEAAVRRARAVADHASTIPPTVALAPRRVSIVSEERSFDVPIRLGLVPSGT
jgi:hypothetical protein